MIVRTLMERARQWVLLGGHPYFHMQRQWQPALAGIPADIQLGNEMAQANDDNNASWWDDALWFAVPKSKVTRGKKRRKHFRYKIKPKQNIVIDKRTGEETLSHKLPFNWKEYLPKLD
mmetsp:Transcript_37228/g.77289  ORF Transcript_37228/g.77289 Transcript_37228/m.77289 type:complete len:118 (-) Transcript_37228:840-1193(-)